MKETISFLLDRSTQIPFLKSAKRSFQALKIETTISSRFARAAATAPLREIDATDPQTWEFSGFSQSGEDGIIDYLCSRMTAHNRFFFEIGSANGLENCTAWLALARGYGGVMVDGSSQLTEQCRQMLNDRLWNVYVANLMVDLENVESLMKMCPYDDPDIFAIDIDGIDYYILKSILALGYRPKVIVAEYNSVFGPKRSVTVPYRKSFNRWSDHASGLFYGVSISALRKLLNQYGYKFVTVTSSGINAFFINPSVFPQMFVDRIRGIEFRDNLGDLNGATRPFRDATGALTLAKRDWRSQQELIKNLPTVEI
jgi:hypothetical protein